MVVLVEGEEHTVFALRPVIEHIRVGPRIVSTTLFSFNNPSSYCSIWHDSNHVSSPSVIG